jgi:hypothetical protein
LPVFEPLLQQVISEETIQQFETIKASEQTPLLVKIHSFSYLKNGYPVDQTKNGGGYVFDCRGILNPGRIEEYKTQSGQDKPVKDFLEQQTSMPKFLNSIYDIIDIADSEKTYEKRYAYLQKLFRKKYTHLILSPTYNVSSVSEIMRYHSQFVKDGYEGIILRAKEGIYDINKRSKYLQKYKSFMEEEFKIVGYHQGVASEKGLVIWECITPEGKRFKVRPRGSFEMRRKLFQEAQSYIGKYLTVVFKRYSEEGIPIELSGKDIRDIY